MPTGNLEPWFKGRLENAGAGFKQSEQAIRLARERFQVPEVMFNPTDAQIDHCGIHEAVHAAVLKCPAEYQPILYRNIMMMGGNTGFKNFRARLLDGIRGWSHFIEDNCRCPFLG